MQQTQDILQFLFSRYPLDENKRHNISLDKNGGLLLRVYTGESWVFLPVPTLMLKGQSTEQLCNYITQQIEQQ